jgi:hypothetical protein
MMTFDGGAREVCIPRRIRTNTPLQALTSLNDSTSHVIARNLAFRMQKTGGKEASKQIQKGYEIMMYKPISPVRQKALVDLYNTALNKFKKDKKAMNEIIGLKSIEKGSNPETAAMVIVAGAMLNMDEWLNKN